MLIVYSVALTLVASIYAFLTIVFTRAVERRTGKTHNPGDFGVSYLRMSARLLFSEQVRLDRPLHCLRRVLRLLVSLLIIGFLGAVYIDATEGTGSYACELCQLDPRGRGAFFWIRLGFPMLLVASASLIEILLARLDRRTEDSGDWFDKERFGLAWQAIVEDRMPVMDRTTFSIRSATRWVVLLFIVDALLMLGRLFLRFN